MNFSEILVSLLFSLNIGCVWFLSRSFMIVGIHFIRALGTGALFERPLSLFGVRYELVEAVMRQKAEVAYGLLMFLGAAIVNIIFLFNPPEPKNWWLCAIILVFTTTVILLTGHYGFVPHLYFRFFMKNAKASLANNKEWIQLDSKVVKGKMERELKCYHLGDYYEKKAIDKLERYLISLQNRMADDVLISAAKTRKTTP